MENLSICLPSEACTQEGNSNCLLGQSTLTQAKLFLREGWAS